MKILGIEVTERGLFSIKFYFRWVPEIKETKGPKELIKLLESDRLSREVKEMILDHLEGRFM